MPTAGIVSAVPASTTARGDRPRDPEVGDDRLAVLQQDVLRLDVAVDDALPVGVVERAGDLADDARCVLERQRPFARQALRAATRPRRTA